MLVKDILSNVEKLLSNSSSYRLGMLRLGFYLDSAVDFINEKLYTNYKTIEEAYEASGKVDELLEFDYKEFPNRYIRNVLIYKTASLYLEEEDETEQQYQVYKFKAEDSLALWKQDVLGCLDMEDSSFDYTPYNNAFDDLNNFVHGSEKKEQLIGKYQKYLVELGVDPIKNAPIILEINRIIKQLQG